MRSFSGCVLSANVFITGRWRSNITRCLNCAMAATQVPIAQATSSGRGAPAVNEEDVIIILHQQQTMHVAHNIPNTIHTFSEGTQIGSLCTYSACTVQHNMLHEPTTWKHHMYLYWTRTDSHTGTYSTKGSVCVDSQRKEVMMTESIATSFTDVHIEWV